MPNVKKKSKSKNDCAPPVEQLRGEYKTARNRKCQHTKNKCAVGNLLERTDDNSNDVFCTTPHCSTLIDYDSDIDVKLPMPRDLSPIKDTSVEETCLKEIVQKRNRESRSSWETLGDSIDSENTIIPIPFNESSIPKDDLLNTTPLPCSKFQMPSKNVARLQQLAEVTETNDGDDEANMATAQSEQRCLTAKNQNLQDSLCLKRKRRSSIRQATAPVDASDSDKENEFQTSNSEGECYLSKMNETVNIVRFTYNEYLTYKQRITHVKKASRI